MPSTNMEEVAFWTDSLCLWGSLGACCDTLWLVSEDSCWRVCLSSPLSQGFYGTVALVANLSLSLIDSCVMWWISFTRAAPWTTPEAEQYMLCRYTPLIWLILMCTQHVLLNLHLHLHQPVPNHSSPEAPQEHSEAVSVPALHQHAHLLCSGWVLRK